MIVKEASARIKAVADIEPDQVEGEFTALVSVFDSKDTYGDVIRKGAFANTIKEWEESDDFLPVVWAHDWADPFAHIGRVTKAEETDEGLVITGLIEDMDSNPTAAQVYRLLKGRRIKNFSFAYDVLDGGYKKDDEFGEYYELTELKVHEVGPCLVGVNQDTQLLDVKAQAALASVKAGRSLSEKNIEHLVAARDALVEVLKASVPEEEGAGKIEEASQAETDETEELGKSVGAPRRALAIATITTMEGMSHES